MKIPALFFISLFLTFTAWSQTVGETGTYGLIPWSLVEEAPAFPQCESTDLAVLKKCTRKRIGIVVSQNFNPEIVSDLGYEGKFKIRIEFTINKQGEAVKVQTTSPHAKLKEEAERVVALLPKMKPGKFKDEIVEVHVVMPLVLMVKAKTDTLKEKQH